MNTHSPGSGSIWYREDGCWHSQLMDGYTSDGNKSIISATGKTRAEVLTHLQKPASLSEICIYNDAQATVNDWSEIWYQDHRSQVQPSTYCGYQYTLQIIRRELGNYRICDILPIHINRMLDRLVAEQYGISQIHKCRVMLIQIFDTAQANGILDRNPARLSKRIRDVDGSLSAPRYERDAFTPEEVQILMDKLKDDLLGNSIRVLLNSGIRVQELLALSPEDIANNGSSVHVNKAIKMVADVPQLGPPKSLRSIRTIPLPENIWPVAERLKTQGGSTLIWSLPGNNPCYSVRSFRRRYYTALKQIDGVRQLSPHCCRHTYVTNLQAHGIPLELIARLAGHSSIETTDRYAHITENTLQSAVASLCQHSPCVP